MPHFVPRLVPGADDPAVEHNEVPLSPPQWVPGACSDVASRSQREACARHRVRRPGEVTTPGVILANPGGV